MDTNKPKYYIDWFSESDIFGSQTENLVIRKIGKWYDDFLGIDRIVYNFGEFTLDYIEDEKKRECKIIQREEAVKKATRYCNILNHLFL